MKNSFLMLSLLTLSIVACDKEDDANPDPMVDTEAPVITVIAPDTAVNYMSGMTMPIQIKVEDNDEIHEIHLNVVNTTQNDSVMLHIHRHAHGQVAMIDTSYTFLSMGMHQDYEIRIMASDHAANQSSKVVHQHVHR